MARAFVNGRVLTEQGLRDDVAVLVDGDRIEAIVAADDPRVRDADRHDLHGDCLLPGFIDCQVNGGGDVLFNDAPTVETIRRIGAAHRTFGTTGFLPTLISDDLDVMRAAIAAVDAAIAEGVPGVLGIHLEGPYLAPARRGVHDAAKFRVPDAAEIALVASLRNGKTLLTIAPERLPLDAIRELTRRGVIVCAGHTAATYEETRAALDAGLRGFTHLYNAMSPLTSREPGVVGAALDDAASACGIVVDGFHVHPASLRVALHAKPRGKVFLVTDAMPPVGGVRDTYTLGGITVTCRDGRCETPDGVIAGSALDMMSAMRNAVAMLDVDVAEAARMASTYPAEFLGLASHGRIAPGARAAFVVADRALRVRDVVG
ncbi:MAG TPA: N-acetylglucosamine-6-phosphate deacetylase [Rhodanobacteraceae bacterium]|nr:N-acetylglucosamine-6-phosphate deacetylase [Rhodanobacteraceae bacterium]